MHHTQVQALPYTMQSQTPKRLHSQPRAKPQTPRSKHTSFPFENNNNNNTKTEWQPTELKGK